MTTQTERPATRDELLQRRNQSRPIVAALGESNGADAVRVAAALAERTGDALVVLSVVEPPPVYALDSQRLLLTPWKVEEQRTQRAQHVEHRLRQLLGTDDIAKLPRVSVSFGDPRWSIPTAASDANARILVMGIGAHDIRHRLLATELTLATSRSASCPVLAVHERNVGVPNVAVVATDFSPESIHAAMEALPFLGERAVVHLVHVWSRLRTPYPVPALAELDESYAHQLPDRFAHLRAVLEASNKHNYTFTMTVREGSPAEELLAVARETGADIVVAGTRGIGALERLLVGSVSSALLRGAECSVMLVPPPDSVERGRLTRLLGGTSTVRTTEEWASELEAFATRNAGRRTTLEVDDRLLGAQRQASGYPLLGATYDASDGRVELMLGSPDQSGTHLTHTIGEVRSVSIASSPSGEDVALCVETEHSRTILSLLDRLQ